MNGSGGIALIIHVEVECVSDCFRASQCQTRTGRKNEKEGKVCLQKKVRISSEEISKINEEINADLNLMKRCLSEANRQVTFENKFSRNDVGLKSESQL